MSDELVERLLDWPYQGETMAHEAADRIEQLVATVEALKAHYEILWETNLRIGIERDRLREALTVYADPCDATETTPCGYEADCCCRTARAALKGETP